MKIIIDAGHTHDYAREHPAYFNVDWSSGIAGKVAQALGFGKATNDSVEHILNLAIAKALELQLLRNGHDAEVVDYPDLANNTEISRVIGYVNSRKPGLFVSIHNNAAGTGNAKELKAGASGTVTLYCKGSKNGYRLARCIADAMRNLRAVTAGPDNRCDTTMQSTLPILAKTQPVAALVEVGFYDNLNDLYWMATHLEEIGKALATGIETYIKG